MNTAKKYGAGMRVKIVPQHWLRGGEIGQLVRFEQRGQNNWLVKFDQCFPGGGIDGDKLWLGQREFVEATDEDISMNSMAGQNDEGENAFLPGDLHRFEAQESGNDLGKKLVANETIPSQYASKVLRVHRSLGDQPALDAKIVREVDLTGGVEAG